MSSDQRDSTPGEADSQDFLDSFTALCEACWRSLKEAPDVEPRIPRLEDVTSDLTKPYMSDARIQYLARWLAMRDEVLEQPQGEKALFQYFADISVTATESTTDLEPENDWSHPLMTDPSKSPFTSDASFLATLGRDFLVTLFQADHKLHYRHADHMPHPLAPLIVALQKRVEADRRKTGILPTVAARVRTEVRTSAPGVPPADLDVLGPVTDSGMGYLPGLAPSETALVESAIPLVLWDSTDSPKSNGGRGAPLALRIWIETLLSVPLADRRRLGSIRMEIPLRELVAWLWPNGWNRGRNWPQLAQALSSVHSARIPWAGGAWSAVSVVNIPSELDHLVVLDVSLPPGSERGPMIRRDVLRRWGLDSAPAYRAYLGLALLWDRYGTSRNSKGESRRIYADVPVDWSNPSGPRELNPARARIPALSSADILALTATPNDARAPSTRRVTLRKGREALLRMEAAGDITIEQLDGGLWRILEPPPSHVALAKPRS